MLFTFIKGSVLLIVLLVSAIDNVADLLDYSGRIASNLTACIFKLIKKRFPEEFDASVS